VIRLPRQQVEGKHRPDFATQVAQQSYTRPRPGITPGGLGYAGSWAMSQRLGAAGHLEVVNGQTYVKINSNG